jgi:hypothetical protein
MLKQAAPTVTGASLQGDTQNSRGGIRVSGAADTRLTVHQLYAILMGDTTVQDVYLTVWGSFGRHARTTVRTRRRRQGDFTTLEVGGDSALSGYTSMAV